MRVVAFTRTLRYVVSSHFPLINRVAVDAPTSTVSSPGALESSSKSCRSDQPTLGLGWHGAEHGHPNRAGPARFHLGSEPNMTRVNIPARADWCLSHRQRACGRQRAIRCLKVRSFRRGTNLFSSTSNLGCVNTRFRIYWPNKPNI